MDRTDNLRIERLRPLLSPAVVVEEHPLTEAGSEVVTRGRRDAARVLAGEDDRLLVVVGPCSVHDPQAALEYASRLAAAASRRAHALHVVMRVYFEKPRTTVGWKGLINDPDLDGSFQINRGLRLARELLLGIVGLGVPVGVEFLDPITPQFIADLVAWGAIGARTTESQTHRELASGLSMPVGFKNGTGGSVQIAVDAVRAARHPHRFLGVTSQGLAAIVHTMGNPTCHIILRGGATGPNYEAPAVRAAADRLARASLPTRLMVDCSHGNSQKDATRQPAVVRAVAEQIAGGSEVVAGVMLESFLEAGRQDLQAGQPLRYGQSITDACMGWSETVEVLDALASAVEARRGRRCV